VNKAFAKSKPMRRIKLLYKLALWFRKKVFVSWRTPARINRKWPVMGKILSMGR
jgi:hypothetical protein